MENYQRKRLKPLAKAVILFLGTAIFVPLMSLLLQPHTLIHPIPLRAWKTSDDPTRTTTISDTATATATATATSITKPTVSTTKAAGSILEGMTVDVPIRHTVPVEAAPSIKKVIA